MEQADTVGLKQEKIPVEVLPGTELHVDKSRQHHEHDPGNRYAFLIHESESPRGGLGEWQWRGTSHKVNESEAGVNASAVGRASFR